MPRGRRKIKLQVKSFYSHYSTRGVGFLVLGLICLSIYAGWKVYRSQILSFALTPQTETIVNPSQSTLIQITFPSLNRTLPVEPATITDGTWEVSATGASHWDNSSNPGQGGNIVIYGHNKQHLFGPIRTLKVGDNIELTDASNKVHRYTITNTAIIPPTNLDYILPTSAETLTLYTCTGLLDKDRFIIVAKPEVI